MDERRRVGGMRLSCRGLSPAREREYAAWAACHWEEYVESSSRPFMWDHSYRGCGVVRRGEVRYVGMCVPLARMAVEATSEA